MTDLDERLSEPEFMDEEVQARAYAGADFTEPHERFIEQFKTAFPHADPRHALDLGCGPGDVTRRFARAFPNATVTGVDGAQAMLDAGREANEAQDLGERLHFVYGRLPGAKLPRDTYDTIISNSLLHHLEDPLVMWQCIRDYAEPGARIFVMDLLRPATRQQAQALVETYSGGEPDVLKRDFFHSLLAAYRPGEVRTQLRACGLGDFEVRTVSDRHLIVCGCAPATW